MIKSLFFINLAMITFYFSVSGFAESHLAFEYGIEDHLEWIKSSEAKILGGENNPDKPLHERDENFTPFSTVVYSFSSYFFIDKNVDQFNEQYLVDSKLWDNVDAISSYKTIKAEDVFDIIKKKHYWNKFLSSDAYYSLSKVRIPNDNVVRGVIIAYKASKLQLDFSDLYSISAISDFRFSTNEELGSDFHDSILDMQSDQMEDLPYAHLPIRGAFKQTMFWVEHFLRYSNVLVSFKEVSPNKTMVIVNGAFSINKSILETYFDVEMDNALFNGIDIENCSMCQKGLINLTKETVTNMKKEFSR